MIALSVVSIATAGQDNALMKKINAMGSVEMNYTLVIDNQDGKTVSSQNGILFYQDGLYKLESDNLCIYCDGKSRWIYSVASEEVVIMKNDYNSSSPADNPLMLLADSKVRDNGDGSYRIVYSDDNDFLYTVKISSVKKSENHSSSFFVLNENSLGDDVIVTDLR